MKKVLSKADKVTLDAQYAGSRCAEPVYEKKDAHFIYSIIDGTIVVNQAASADTKAVANEVAFQDAKGRW